MRGFRFPYMLVLVVVSAAGFLGVGLVVLGRQARESVELLASKERELTRQRAGLIARRLRDKDFLEELPSSSHFSLRNGQLVIPPELGWLEERPGDEPATSWKVEVALREAERLEFGTSESEKARDRLVEVARDATLSEADRSRLLVAAAWAAERADAREERDARLAGLKFGKNPRPDPWEVSWLLLRCTADGAIGPTETGLLMRLPARTRRPLLRRLSSRVDPVDLNRAETEARRAARRRTGLTRVAAQAEALGAATEPWLGSVGDDLLIFAPAGAGAGSGALLPPSSLPDSLVPDGVALVFGDDPPEGAVFAAPLISVVGINSADRAPGPSPLLVGTLLVTLAVGFSTGLFLTIRGLRREARSAELKAEFLTSVTHELKTPLASIRLLAEMLEEGKVAGDVKRREYHRMLSGEAGRLSMLIENVLDLGRMERGERSYDMRQEEVVVVAEEAAEIFAPIAEREGIEIVTRIGTARPSGRIDRGALIQALLNLFENARKYAGEGGRIELADESESDRWRVSLRDHGPGIPPEEREAVFARFRRGEAQADGRVPGVGLGLYLARRIFKDHGGRLFAIDPADGGPGACFVAEIPLLQERE